MRSSQNFWDKNAERYDHFMRKDAVTPIQLHAWGFIVMERAASHPVPTYMDSIMLRSLSCCNGLLHSFKYIQIYPSLKRKST